MEELKVSRLDFLVSERKLDCFLVEKCQSLSLVWIVDAVSVRQLEDLLLARNDHAFSGYGRDLYNHFRKKHPYELDVFESAEMNDPVSVSLQAL